MNDVSRQLKPSPSALHSAAWNYIGHASQLATSFGLTYFIVRHLSLAEYGVLVLITSLSVNIYLLDLGISSVLVPQYVAARIEGGMARLNDLLSVTFALFAGLGTVGALLMVALALILPGPFKIPAQYVHDGSIAFLLAAITIQMALPVVAIEQAYQAADRFDRLNQIRMLCAVAQLLFTSGALLLGYRIIGLVAVQAILACIQILLLLLALPASIPGARLSFRQMQWGLLSQLSRPGRWAFLNNVGSSFFDVAAWIPLSALASIRELAFYGLALKLPRQTWNLVDRGANVLLPALSRAHAEGNRNRLREIYFMEQTLLVGAVAPIALLGVVFAEPILQFWAGDAYIGAAPAMRWLLLWIFGQCIAYPSNELLYACGEVRQSAIFSLVASAVAFIPVLILTPRYGAAGLAASIALAQVFTACPFFLIAGVKLSGASIMSLLRATLHGMLVPGAVLLLSIAVVHLFAEHLSRLTMLVAAAVCGLLYFAVWGRLTALPLYRNRVRT